SRRGRRRSNVPDAPSFTREAALELLEAHGLGEAVVEPGLERPAAFVLVLAGRQRDEDRAGRPSLAAHPLTELAAAQPWKIEVEDDDLGLVDASGVEGRVRIRERVDVVAATAEEKLEPAQHSRVLVDQEHARAAKVMPLRIVPVAFRCVWRSRGNRRSFLNGD